MGTEQKVNSAASLSPTMIDPDIEGLSKDVARLTLPLTLNTADGLMLINDDNVYEFARSFGVGNSATSPEKSALESTLTKYVRLLPARFFPFCPPYNDKNLIQFAYAAGAMRCAALDVYDENIILAITIGECFSPGLPDNKFETLEKSREAIRHDVQKALRNIRCFHVQLDAHSYAHFHNENGIAKHFPNAKDYSWIVRSPPDEEIRLTTFQTAMKFIYFLSRSICSINNVNNYVVVHAYCALAKRGFITREFCRKISATMKEELEIHTELNAEAIRIAYQTYMKDCQVSKVTYLEFLLSHIPKSAVKLIAMLQQAQNIHLTVFIIIGKAIKVFPYFDWLKLNEITQGELQNWAEICNGLEPQTDFPITAISRHSEEQMNNAKYMSVGCVARSLLAMLRREKFLWPFKDIFSDISNTKPLNTLVLEYCALKNIGTRSNSFLPPWYKTMLSTLDYPIFLY